MFCHWPKMYGWKCQKKFARMYAHTLWTHLHKFLFMEYLPTTGVYDNVSEYSKQLLCLAVSILSTAMQFRRLSQITILYYTRTVCMCKATAFSAAGVIYCQYVWVQVEQTTLSRCSTCFFNTHMTYHPVYQPSYYGVAVLMFMVVKVRTYRLISIWSI